MNRPFDELNTPCNCEGRGFYTRAQIDAMLQDILDPDAIENILNQMFTEYITEGDLYNLIINAIGDVYSQEQIDAMLATKLDVSAFTQFSTEMQECCTDVNILIAELTEKTRHQELEIHRLWQEVFPQPVYTGITMTATYNVTSTQNPTTILNSLDSIVSATYEGSPITLGQTFTFDQVGDREITFVFYFEQNPIKTPASTFEGVTALKSAVFDNGGLINNNFFKDSGLQAVTLPSSLTNIYDGVFMGTPLTEITIPKSVNSIWTSVFEGCNSLSAVTFEAGGTVELRLLCNVFYGCEDLATITFPDRLTQLYCDTFSENMTSITFEGSNPPSLWNKDNALGPVEYNFPIYVPAAAVQAYQNHLDWENYANRVTSA